MDFSSVGRGLLGLIIVTGIAFLFSPNKRAISWRLVAVGLGMQFVFALFVLKTDIGRQIFDAISKAFVRLFAFALNGAQFVFGSLATSPGEKGSLGFFFAFQVLPTIIFLVLCRGLCREWPG